MKAIELRNCYRSVELDSKQIGFQQNSPDDVSYPLSANIRISLQTHQYQYNLALLALKAYAQWLLNQNHYHPKANFHPCYSGYTSNFHVFQTCATNACKQLHDARYQLRYCILIKIVDTDCQLQIMKNCNDRIFRPTIRIDWEFD